MKKLTFLLLLFIAVTARAERLKPLLGCGIHQIEGYMAKEKGRLLFFINKNATSQITVDLGPYDKKYRYDVGTDVKLDFSISNSCWYQCKGRVIRIVSRLEPYEKAKIFSTIGYAPLKKKKCAAK